MLVYPRDALRRRTAMAIQSRINASAQCRAVRRRMVMQL